MSPGAVPRRGHSGGRPPSGGPAPGEQALAPEEVAAILAAVRAVAEEETGSEAPAPAASEAWAAAGRPGREASPRHAGGEGTVRGA